MKYPITFICAGTKYNEVATKYNDNLVKRKNVCIKLLKMRPLNTYKVK